MNPAAKSVGLPTALPRDCYVSQAIYEQELERVFHRQWLLVGHVSLVKNIGDFYVKQIGPESMIIVRDSENRIRSFFNVCRHRGFRICDAGAAGNAKRLTCPYHAWSYDIDGGLVAVPGTRDGEQFDFSAWGLHEAWCETQHGFIFLCLSKDKPRALAEVLGPICNQQALDAIQPARMKLVRRETYLIEANWKTVVENDSECYHCGVAHPALAQTCNYQAFFTDSKADGYFALRPGMKTFSMDGEWVCKKRLGVPQAEGFSTGFLLFPFFEGPVFFADHCVSLETTPLGVDRTQMISEWYVHEDAVEGVDYDPQTVAEIFHITNLEDAALMARNYAGVRSARYVPGPLSATREHGVRYALDLYREMMGELPATRKDEPSPHPFALSA
jgi:phenylpropionate dioxygenase-like ring-hydroxylating dioxygenase large terminal subunit